MSKHKFFHVPNRHKAIREALHKDIMYLMDSFHSFITAIIY